MKKKFEIVVLVLLVIVLVNNVVGFFAMLAE